MGEAPEHIVLVETEDDVDALEVADPEQDRLRLADHAVGRRDARDHRPPARAVPAASPGPAPTTSATPRPTARPPSSDGRRSATSCSSSARRTRRTHSASSRSRATTAPRPPDRQRRPGRRGVARGQAHRRDLLRRQRARGARRAARGVLPRARRPGRLGVPGRLRGRPLHASEADPPGARSAGQAQQPSHARISAPCSPSAGGGQPDRGRRLAQAVRRTDGAHAAGPVDRGRARAPRRTRTRPRRR